MRKQLIHRAVITLLLGCIMLLAFAGCGKSNEKRNVSGSYHTEANGHKRGTGVDINLEGDKITTIVVNDMDSEYSLTDPDAFQFMWPTKQTMVLQELQNMGPDKIAEIKITADDNGIPTKIEGFNLEVIPEGCTDCAGMLILAVQDALSK